LETLPRQKTPQNDLNNLLLKTNQNFDNKNDLSILVSICCLTFNHQNYIRQCLDGFMVQQTNFKFEVLIHDDASTDNTATIVREYEHKYPAIIKPIYQTENQYSNGIKPSIKFQFPRVKGKYIAMCEGDDYWTDPLKLQKQVDFMESHPNLSFCFHGAQTLTADGIYGIYYKKKQFKDRQLVPKKYFLESGGGGYCTASSFFRTSVVKSIPQYFTKCPVGDLPLALLAITKGDIGYLKDEMAVYRLMTDNSWSQVTKFDKKNENLVIIFDTIKQFEIQTNFKYSNEMVLLKKVMNYKFGFYNYKHSIFKSLKYAIKNFNKMGILYSLKLIKDSFRK